MEAFFLSFSWNFIYNFILHNSDFWEVQDIKLELQYIHSEQMKEIMSEIWEILQKFFTFWA